MPAERRNPSARLSDMLDAIVGIRGAVAGLDFEDYERVWTVRRAVERGFEIISEASRHLPPDLKARHQHVAWARIAGIGNVLRHDYQRIEDRLIWNLLGNHLDELETVIRLALAEGGSDGS